MFKFKGISSKDMQVVVEEEEHFIARASQRYEMTEIEGRDGAIFDELGYSVVERPIYVQCLNINKIDDILAWLNGEGEFEYKGRKTTARFYSQLEPQRSSCIRIIDTTFIRDPFWCKVNEDYQLVKDRKDKQASGEYIHVEDSSNCRGKIGISGNSEQETRSGKNYLNTLAKYKAGDTVTVEGITYTFNNDGSITCNGTASADSILDISKNIQKINGTNKKIAGLLTGNQVPVKMGLLAYTSTYGATVSIMFSEVNKSIQTKMQENKDYMIFRIIVYRGTTVNNQTVYYQILDTSETDLTYEQYGVSPSPNYLSPIKAVGSNVNLFDKNKFNNFTKNLQYIELTLKPNTEYTMRSNITRDKYGCNLFAYKTGEAASSGSNFVVDGTDRIVTTGDDGIIIIAYRNYNASLSDDPKNDYKYKLVEGTEVGEYSSYGQGCVKVTKCNKNLFPSLKSQSKENRGITLSYNADTQEFNVKGTTTDTVFYTTLTFEELKYLSKDKKYILSISNLIPKKCMVALTKINVINNGIIHEGEKQTTVDNLDKYKPDGFMVYGQNLEIGTKIEFTFKAQIEEGLTATEREQHEEQSYIMPTQAEMLVNDYLDYDNEEEVHVWGKKIFDGTELWNKSGNKYPTFYFSPYDISSKYAVPENAKGLCNYFKQIGSIWEQDVMAFDIVNITTTHSNVRFCLGSNSTITTLEEWKNKLTEMYNSGQPVVLYFQLRTPIRLKFTDEQKAVAKELNNARTYKNVTNITTDSKAILSLDYFTVTDEKIKNEGNIQSRPILRLEKTVSEAVDITINGVRFKYNFNNDKYVEIDCENKEVKCDGLERFRSIEIGYDFPKLNIGNNEIIINDGDCIIKVIRKDRWL